MFAIARRDANTCRLAHESQIEFKAANVCDWGFPSLFSWASDELMEEPVKRHSDAIFTDNYSRFRKQMAVKKYLNSVLTGKRR